MKKIELTIALFVTIGIFALMVWAMSGGMGKWLLT